jgi:hypothetical protein
VVGPTTLLSRKNSYLQRLDPDATTVKKFPLSQWPKSLFPNAE